MYMHIVINFFNQGAVGALDGTLIHAIVPRDKQHLYRARGRSECYQNVLAICDFNMVFTFIVAGWEGTAHDARILNESLVDPDFEFPFPPKGITISNIIFVMLHINTNRFYFLSR